MPLQDLLGLGTDARMNIPGRADGNWSWRYEAAAPGDDVSAHLQTMTTTFGRARRPRMRAKG